MFRCNNNNNNFSSPANLTREIRRRGGSNFKIRRFRGRRDEDRAFSRREEAGERGRLESILNPLARIYSRWRTSGIILRCTTEFMSRVPWVISVPAIRRCVPKRATTPFEPFISTDIPPWCRSIKTDPIAQLSFLREKIDKSLPPTSEYQFRNIGDWKKISKRIVYYMRVGARDGYKEGQKHEAWPCQLTSHLTWPCFVTDLS